MPPISLQSHKKNDWAEKTENKAVGQTRGGLNTKIHAIVDGLGNPVVFLRSPGNDNNSTHAINLMSLTDISGSNLLGDKAYGTKEILAYIKEHGGVVVTPPKSNAKQPGPVDYHLYKERHLVECFFQKIKWFRRVATRSRPSHKCNFAQKLEISRLSPGPISHIYNPPFCERHRRGYETTRCHRVKIMLYLNHGKIQQTTQPVEVSGGAV